LIWACTEKAGNVNLVALLLNSGANVNHQNRNGATPLRFAATSNFLPIVELLMQRGADQSIPNNKGETPLQVARARNKRAVYKYLLKLNQEKREKEKKAVEQKIKDSFFPQVAKSMSYYVAKLLVEGGEGVTLNVTTTEEPRSPSLNAAETNVNSRTISPAARNDLEKAIEKGLVNNNVLFYCWDENKPDHMAARMTICDKLVNSLKAFITNETMDKITAQTIALAQVFLYEFQRRDRSLNGTPETSLKEVSKSKDSSSRPAGSKNRSSIKASIKDLNSKEREEKILESF